MIISYIFIVFFHIILLSPYFHPGIGVYFSSDGPGNIGNFVGDEAAYRIYAESLRHLTTYPANAAYPPVYPLMLAVAELLSPADPIKAMIIANIAVAFLLSLAIRPRAPDETQPSDYADRAIAEARS